MFFSHTDTNALVSLYEQNCQQSLSITTSKQEHHITLGVLTAACHAHQNMLYPPTNQTRSLWPRVWQDSDMGLGKGEKGGKWCGGLGAAVGPQWGPGAKPLVGGSGGNVPRSWRFFQYVITKKQHFGAWKSDICKSASFMFRPDIYLVILKIALKMSFWYSKNKILAKVPNHLTATISLGTSVKKKKKKKSIPVQHQNIFWYRYSILFNLSATTKRRSLCVKVEKNRNFSTQILRIA